MIMTSFARLFSIAALLMGAVVVYAGGVDFTAISSWSQALDLAKKANKPIFLDAYTDWCGWCKVMDTKTFADPKVAAFMNEHFVNVKMEMETGEGVDVAMKYRISSFPTFKVFAVDGTPTYTVFGYQDPDSWLKTLEMMVDPSKAQIAKGVSSQLDLAWPSWHRGAFLKGKSRKMPDAGVVQEWFAQQQDKYSEVAWSIVMKYNLTEEQSSWILAHEANYRALYGTEFDGFVQRYAQATIGNAIKQKDRPLLDRATQLMVNIVPEQADAIRLRVQGMYHQSNGEWTELSLLVERASQSASTTADIVNDFAWSMYEKCGDNAALLKAADAMKRKVVDLDVSDWAFVDTYAALLYKTAQLEEAERQALRAIAMGKESEADVTETQALLVKIRAAKK
ncbi:MAG: DUF255 domain-containing protein [Candidatus Kapabacteria bacterium]|nr:DUF255 domain-containing protein [Candidatus Kapabacteria bacterium]